MELDESFEEGVRREVLEETGLTITVERLAGVYKNLNGGFVALVFRCSPAGGDAHSTPEVREVRWMTREQVQSSMNPAFAVRILEAFDDHVQSRAHDGVNLVSI